MAYAQSGTADFSFAGHDADIVNSGSEILYDTLYRELSAVQGRWIQPDPAGMAAANPGNPQTFNAYAYVANNPLVATDALGLDGGPCGQGSGPYGAVYYGSELCTAYNAYASGMYAIWKTGGSVTVGSYTYWIDWAIPSGMGSPSGAFYTNAAGAPIQASELDALGLTPLSAAPDDTMPAAAFAAPQGGAPAGGGAAASSGPPTQQHCLTVVQSAVNSDLHTQSVYLGPTAGMDPNGERAAPTTSTSSRPGSRS